MTKLVCLALRLDQVCAEALCLTLSLVDGSDLIQAQSQADQLRHEVLPFDVGAEPQLWLRVSAASVEDPATCQK